MPKFVNRTVPGKDRMIGKLNQSSWANARDAASGTAASDTGDPAARRDMAALDEFKLVVVGVKDYTNTASTADKRTLIDSVDDSTAANRPLLRWVEASGARKVRTTKGARTRGFKTRNVNITTGGKTVANGFSDD
jgi:hypothetical protein